MSFLKNFTLLIIPLALYSCASNTPGQSRTENATVELAPQIDSSKILADSAMALLVVVNEYVAKGIKKEMSNKEVNGIINPMMERYFALYSKLKPEDTLRVRQFRIDKLNEIIDLQIQYSN